MKRLLCLVVLLLCVSGAVVAAPSASASTQDFRFQSFNADYYLDQDAQHHSTLRVMEQLVAVFPSYDQNHGIERAIPEEYDNHPVSLHIQSVQDEQGTAYNYTTYESNGNTIVRIGDANRYVHGTHTYMVSYTLQDVTKSFSQDDELYWDTNGTEWQQPFGTVTARLHIPIGLQQAFTGKTACYTGPSGSNISNCTISTAREDGGSSVVTVQSTRQLNPDENMTMVAGFKPHTFAAYVPPPTKPIDVITYIIIAVVILGWYITIPIIAAFRAWRTWKHYGRDPKGQGTIIPEYIPPKGVSVAASSVILKDHMQTSAVSAQLIDLAVRGYLRLYETGKKKYEMELLKPTSDLLPEELAVLQLWYDPQAQPGDREKITDSGSKYTKVLEVIKLADQRAHDQLMMQDVSKRQKRLSIWGGVLLALSVFTFNPLGLVAGIIILICANKMPARTETGVQLRDYLHGLKMYMNFAEADRIRALQAPGTAEKIDVNDKGQLIKLYEHLLPYAMLFGIEKQWANQFASLYTQPPDWYSGNWSAFNAGVFAGSIANLASTTGSNFAPPSSSSSSGFGGGGFSGGGGGGGGGGGW